MSAAKKIREYILRRRCGEPFTARNLLHLASRESVDQVLSQLTRQGRLQRIRRGVYFKPMIHPMLGPMSVSTYKVIQVVAEANGEVVRSSGAETVNRLGLSTQVPVRPIYLTSGRTRKIRVGQQEVQLRHMNRRYLASDTLAGEVVRALRYLGRRGVSPDVVAKLDATLEEGTKRELEAMIPQLPDWMGRVLREIVAGESTSSS